MGEHVLHAFQEGPSREELKGGSCITLVLKGLWEEWEGVSPESLARCSESERYCSTSLKTVIIYIKCIHFFEV